MTAAITSPGHPLVRTIRLVASGARRAPAELVLAEGLRVLEEATATRLPLEAVLVGEEFGRDPRERALLRIWTERGTTVRTAAGRLMGELSEVVAPQGGIALVRVAVTGLGALDRLALDLVVCLCGVQDPGNLGSIVRTARAAGANLVCTTRGTVSARSPKAVRGSAGAFFHLPLVEGLAVEELLAFCRRRRLAMVRSDPRGSTSLWDADLRPPTALLVGGEARGFSGGAWGEVAALRIPMAARTESLNVAAAAAIVLFEACRQRRRPGDA